MARVLVTTFIVLQITTLVLNCRMSRTELTPSEFMFGVTLGEGSYARVVHAKLKLTAKEFAIKIMEKSHIAKENKVQYVKMEKEILAKVSHPFIIQMCFSFQDAEYLYIGMELVHGGELSAFVRIQRDNNVSIGIDSIACSLSIIKFYSAEIVEALEYLHKMDIVHRDLKPENILISLTGHLKIADFGTALMRKGIGSGRGFSEADVGSMSSDFVGTADYVSPEVLKENEPVTKASDLWALGCIMYYMRCGRTPFGRATEYLTFQAIGDHCNGAKPVELPDSVLESEDLANIISSFLRPKSMERLGAGLDHSCEIDPQIGIIQRTEGVSNGYISLKSHSFFSGVPWGELNRQEAPYLPDPSTFPPTSHMRDGSSSEWLEEGEATQISSKTQSFSVDLESRDSSSAGQLSSSSMLAEKWRQFLSEGEQAIFSSLVWKRRGLFSKKRQLILTDKPRLIYIDPVQMVCKGEMPWTDTQPVSCIVINDTIFDVFTPQTGRKYHLVDEEKGANAWRNHIEAALEQQRNRLNGGYSISITSDSDRNR